MILAIVSFGVAGVGLWAQSKTHFEVQDDVSCEKIHFFLKASSGTCEIRTRHGENPINIMGSSEQDYVTPEFGQQKDGDILHTWLNLNDSGKEGFTSKMSKIFAKKSTDESNYWSIYFTDFKPYDLDLNYGVGKAYVDLSDIAVEKLKITSGHAHVKVGYHSNMGNRVEMDTFLVNVDLGDVEIDRLNMARAKVVVAEVGFGTLTMNFEQTSEISSEIWVRVGAGNLTINMDDEATPMMIRIKNTSYRKLKMPTDFVKIRDNVYVNGAYQPEATNLLTFNIDLAMGSVVFSRN
uniref:hypothetical protein n=1 Tax=Roseivirga sp. TaxID=1964215 RepID=UPI004047AF4D